MAKTHASRFRLLLAVAVFSTCIGCDHATKRLATDSLKHAPPQTYLAGTVRLEFALNPGGFLSLGGNLPQKVRLWIFIGLNACVMLAVVVFMVARRDMSWALFVALTCVLAGGAGNMIDRISNGGLVTDLINVGVGPLRTGIFNVADVALIAGTIAAAILASRQTAAERSHSPNPQRGHNE